MMFKYRIRVPFTNESREIGPEKIKFIEMWVNALVRIPELIKLYKHEILIKSEDKDYWIPMQEQVLPYMNKELKIGKQFDLYIILAGTIKDEWVFLATEFKGD